MSVIHETAEVVGLAVKAYGREPADAIVAPAEAAGEIGDGHHLDGGDAGGGQFRQLAARGLPAAFACKSAYVDFRDHLSLQACARPFAIGPAETRRVHHLRRTVRTVGLEARRRVGKRSAPIQAEAVERTIARLRHQAREVPAGLALERHRGPAFEHHFHLVPVGRPDAEMHAGRAGRDLGSHGEAALHAQSASSRSSTVLRGTIS